MERLLTYDRFISFHRNKLDVQPFPEDKLNMAYLNEKFDQFQIHLENSDDQLIIKTLKEINNQLSDGDEIYAYAILNTNIIIQILKHLRSNKNTDIRVNSSMCFKQFCKLNPAKETINKLNFMEDLQLIFDDQEPLVRQNTVEGLIFYASYRQGQETLLENSVLETIIKKVDNEKSELVLNNFLMLANEILKADKAFKLALDNKYIQVLKKHINHSKAKIRISVFYNFGSLSISEEGKTACTNEGELIINSLKQVNQQIDLIQAKSKPSYYLELDTLNLIISLTRFQNTVSILKRGKVEIFENHGLESYLKLIKIVTNEQILISVLQVIGNTAEEPRARKFMLSHLPEIEIFLKNQHELIQKQAKMTIDIITWKP